MKSASRRHILQIGGLALWVIFGLVMTASAQNREKYIISASAGGINFVTGNVTVQRQGEARQRGLTSTDDLRSGDLVTTGAGGRIEVLLNPGSYMRVDENSEFELTDASLDNLLVKLVKGSAVVEVTGASDVELALGINTPQADASIVRGGIYRFNVLPNETTEIVVRKGRVLFGKDTPQKVKGGQKVLVGRGGVEVAKLNKKEQDTLDVWSKERAETLARANRRLERRTLLTAFDNYNTWADMSGWGQTSPRYGSLGLWVYSSNTRSYCFLPIGPTAWSSPYGHNYGTGIGVYVPGYNVPRGYGGGSTVGGYPSTGNGSTGGNGSVNPSPAPAPTMPRPTRPIDDGMSERVPRKTYSDGNPHR
jgi:hypothetical protein